MIKVFSLFFLIFIFAGCGIKGYPQQPVSYKPTPIEDPKVKQQGNKIIFYWKYTPKYEDGRPIQKPVEFYAVDFNKNTVRLNIKKANNIYWFEEKIQPGIRTYCYRFFVKAGKFFSSLSDFACIRIDKEYPYSLPLSLKLTQEGILLSWSVKTSVNIYKGKLKYVPPVVYRKSINDTKFLDIDVKEDRNYCYYITVPKNKHVEGVPSKVICTTYKDIFPPDPPASGFIYKEKDFALIFWDDSPSKDVKGYKVYKNKKPVVDFLINTYYIRDNNYKEGDIYYITAVDNAGNESKPLIIR